MRLPRESGMGALERTAQLSVTILIAYSIMNLKIKWQFVLSLVLLLTTDLTYRFFPVEGFNHPFVKDQNFGV